MEKQENWYKYTMEEAILRGALNYAQQKEKLARTTVTLPQITRIGIEYIQGKFRGLSQRYILFQMVEHGHSLLEHNHYSELEKIDTARKALAFPRVKEIRDFMYDLYTVPGSMVQPARREVWLRDVILSSLWQTSRIVGIPQSSLIRVCMYYSMTTAEELHPEMHTIAKSEIELFVEHLKRRIVLYKAFVYAEELWEKQK